jgi:2-polyprenyl-3-methyl-5-hydroxy-6-metoxy-1,4-benzoquinol methylase
MNESDRHANEVARGERFAFGENWARFLRTFDENRALEAERALREMLGTSTLAGLKMLDIGSGSGLHSLAACRMGAQVRSFDYDPQSVSSTRKLRDMHPTLASQWQVEQGSVLDSDYMARLGQFELVYSWGVLHHTGQMWRAIDAACARVAPGGKFFIAIYNDQGRSSRSWLRVKRAYNGLPRWLRWLVLWPAFVRLWGPTTVRDVASGRPFATWRGFMVNRGMSPWRDVVDWVGGLPFEVAKPEQVFDFLAARGFRLRKLVTCAGGLGCNEYVFERETPGSNGR